MTQEQGETPAGLSKTACFFLQTLRDFLRGEKSRLPDGADWDELLHLANIHRVSAILFFQLRDETQIPDQAKAELLRKYTDTRTKYARWGEIIQEIGRAFQQEKIRYLVFKGMDFAVLYPHPELRTMRDTDLLVLPEDRERAHRLLLNLGWESVQNPREEWFYDRDGLHLELHDNLLHGDADDAGAPKTFAGRCWQYAEPEPGSTRYHFDWSYHFVFALLHLRDHLVEHGAGFRMFMDLAVLMDSGKLRWDWIETELRRMKMWKFAGICLALCREWFGCAAPQGLPILDEETCAEITRRTMAGGVHGGSDGNYFSNEILSIQIKSKNDWRWKLRYWRLRLFPPYKHLRCVPHYSLLDNRPYLLPLIWGYRFLRLLGARKRQEVLESIRQSGTVTAEQRKDREEYLARWSLRDDV